MLRKSDDTRKKKCIERLERKALEKKEKEEKLKRLKNARRADLEWRLRMIGNVSGSVKDDEEKGVELMNMLEQDNWDEGAFEEIMGMSIMMREGRLIRRM